MDTLTAFRARVRDEARDLKVSPSLAEACLWVPLVGAVVVAVSRFDLAVFRFLTDEDRLLEWLQFIGYTTAAVVGTLIAWSFWRRGERAFALLFALFALGSLFVAGEEIAWGQHIFGWGTPAGLARINHQNETTIHNIDQTPFNVVLLLIGLYGSLVAGFVRYRAGARPSRTVKLLTPPLFLSTAFLVLFLYKLIRFTVLQEPRYYYVNLGEWAEFCLASALAIFAVVTIRWLRAERSARRFEPVGQDSMKPPLGR